LTEEIVMGSKLQTINRAFLAHSAAMLLACVLVGSNAFADEQLRSETVKFEDLNVGTPAGVEALYRRIHSAAVRVCSPAGGWVGQIGAAACTKDAESKAVEKVNLPSLTAFYRMKTGDHRETITAKR
jgi:UrcA family protein